MAYITKGIQLFHKSGEIKLNYPGAQEDATHGILIPGLQDVGELMAGPAANAGFDKIEVTTLADSRHMYVDGLMADAGDASSIAFTLLYDPAVYQGLLALVNEEVGVGAYKSVYHVVIPSGGVFEITGLTNIKMNSASVNAALTMTLTLTPTEEIAFTYSAS